MLKLVLDRVERSKKMPNNIKKLRKSKHITMEQLASYIGVGKPTVSRWESEKILPTLKNWQALADYFNVSIAYLKGAYSKDDLNGLRIAISALTRELMSSLTRLHFKV